jgi:hypothetical protein
MNLTNDEATKVIEALELAENMASVFDQLSQKLGDLRERQTDRSRLEEVTDALAILQAAKDTATTIYDPIRGGPMPAAPVNPPKVSQDEYDCMSFVMRGGVTPIPAKVDVDAAIQEVWRWAMDAKMVNATTEPYSLTNDLRDRLTKLFNA